MLPPAQPAAEQGQPRAKKQGLGAALANVHIARRFFILAYAFLVMCGVYYGISFAVGGLGGSLVTSFSVAALAELPSYLMAAWAIERIGRWVGSKGALTVLGHAVPVVLDSSDKLHLHLLTPMLV